MTDQEIQSLKSQAYNTATAFAYLKQRVEFLETTIHEMRSQIVVLEATVLMLREQLQEMVGGD